eukprot:992868-Amphidinium_carterae.1
MQKRSDWKWKGESEYKHKWFSHYLLLPRASQSLVSSPQALTSTLTASSLAALGFMQFECATEQRDSRHVEGKG